MSFTFDNEPVYKIGDSFTMRNILNIVDKMNAAMPHYEFEPEPVCEGGIRVKQYGHDTDVSSQFRQLAFFVATV